MSAVTVLSWSETRETGKTYHAVSDIVKLIWFGSTWIVYTQTSWFHLIRHSLKKNNNRLPHLSHATLKNWEEPEYLAREALNTKCARSCKFEQKPVHIKDKILLKEGFWGQVMDVWIYKM